LIYAHRFVQRGYDLILVARDQQRLTSRLHSPERKIWQAIRPQDMDNLKPTPSELIGNVRLTTQAEDAR
jgi:short-subunit dehydrogenase